MRHEENGIGSSWGGGEVGGEARAGKSSRNAACFSRTRGRRGKKKAQLKKTFCNSVMVEVGGGQELCEPI